MLRLSGDTVSDHIQSRSGLQWVEVARGLVDRGILSENPGIKDARAGRPDCFLEEWLL